MIKRIVLILCLLLSASAALAQTTQPVLPRWLNGMHYKDMPTARLEANGKFGAARFIDREFYRPTGGMDPTDIARDKSWPDRATCAKLARETMADSRRPILIIDIEEPFWWEGPAKGRELIARTEAVIDMLREAEPQIRLGAYAWPIVPEKDETATVSRKLNDNAARMMGKLDIVCPSVYMGRGRLAEWNATVQRAVNECYRCDVSEKAYLTLSLVYVFAPDYPYATQSEVDGMLRKTVAFADQGWIAGGIIWQGWCFRDVVFNGQIVLKANSRIPWDGTDWRITALRRYVGW